MGRRDTCVPWTLKQRLLGEDPALVLDFLLQPGSLTSSTLHLGAIVCLPPFDVGPTKAQIRPDFVAFPDIQNMLGIQHAPRQHL